MIYLRITRPDGEVLAASSKSFFKFQNASLTYSARREITYEGEKLDVAIYWPNDGSRRKENTWPICSRIINKSVHLNLF